MRTITTTAAASIPRSTIDNVIGDAAAAAYSAWQIIGRANYCSGIITNDEDNEARYHVTCDLRHRH